MRDEKGPLTLRERPKSREETPKEGDGNARETSRYRTAATYTAPHKKQVLLTYLQDYFPQNLLQFVQGRSSRRHIAQGGTRKIAKSLHRQRLILRLKNALIE